MPEIFNAQQSDSPDALLRLIADTVPAMLAYFDAATMACRFANARYAEYFGFSQQEIVGKTVREIAGEAVWNEIRSSLPLNNPSVTDSVRYSRQVVRPDHSIQHIETVLRPHSENGVLQGMVALVTDVSHHHQVMQKLQASEERMRRFASVTTEAIAMHRQGLVIDGNTALTQLLGYSLPELLQNPILDYVAPEYQLSALQTMRNEREERHESVLIHKNGQRIPVEVQAKSMPSDEGDFRLVVFRDMTASHLAREHMNFLAQHDLLTQLPNRARLNELMTQAIAQAGQQQSRLSVLSIDLHQFKAINDSLSHQAGDLVLCEIARRLRSSTGKLDLVARVGGDDFVVVLTGSPTLLETEALAARLRAVIEAPCEIEGTQLIVSPSMGIAIYPKDGESPEVLLSNAEAAMHMAKSEGRSMVQFYTPMLEGRATRMLMQEQMLRAAVENGDFELHYQPQTFTANGQLAGFEALVRWRHPHRGLVPPGEFIGFAENRGLIAAVDRWVMRQACIQAKAWQREGLPAVPIAVNLSPQEFRERDVAREVAEVLHETGLEARYLHIELTETTLMQSSGQMPETLKALKALGVGLAIDDFGTGYSSLAYLRRHPIDTLKIDRSFVTDISHNPDARAIVNAIIQMGRSLNLNIVAEGVETAAQLALLRQLGCAMMQGYLVSLPLPAEQARAWMSQHCHLL
ncbi:bifunctional diguanylate cyclase/phosphodiesterase [Comamonas aquatilis]|uniref:putative bifunctional diguanylate cyclase/phosphodiesterase n=1 Tax=Comamonas aquatilis TaxID=1778406 RepID=UPI0039EE4006